MVALLPFMMLFSNMPICKVWQMTRLCRKNIYEYVVITNLYWLWPPSYLPYNFIHVSVRLGSFAWNRFLRVISVLSDFSECLQIIQNETISRKILVEDTMSHTDRSSEYSVYSNTGAGAVWEAI